MLRESLGYCIAGKGERLYMLLLEAALTGDLAEPFLSFLEGSIMPEFLNTCALVERTSNHLLKRLSADHPLEHAQPVRHWDDLEGLQVEASIGAEGVIQEDLVHQLE